MKTYVIVNKDSRQPIFAIGFCSSYSDRKAAEKAAEHWNENRSPSMCKVAVAEKTTRKAL